MAWVTFLNCQAKLPNRNVSLVTVSWVTFSCDCELGHKRPAMCSKSQSATKVTCVTRRYRLPGKTPIKYKAKSQGVFEIFLKLKMN